MEYFSKFPKIEYNDALIQDITARVDFLKKIKNNVSVFQYFTIPDGQRPEDIAHKLYGDPTLYWIILYLNDIVNPYTDWPLSEEQLLEAIKTKYGVENVYADHHYVTTEDSSLGAGVVVNFGTPFSTVVSNYTYEFELNEEKRKIKILKLFYLQQVLQEYKNAF